MMKIVATNVVVSQPTGTPTACANYFLVAKFVDVFVVVCVVVFVDWLFLFLQLL